MPRRKRARKIPPWFEYSDPPSSSESSSEESILTQPRPKVSNVQPSIPIRNDPVPETHVPLEAGNDHLAALFEEFHTMQEDEVQDLTDLETDHENNGETIDELAKQWLLIELQHNISKTASNLLWTLALKMVPMLPQTKKKPPGFPHLRRKLYQNNLPPIKLSFGFEHKATGQLHYVQQETTPLSKYPSSQYRKLYEIATIQVKTLNSI